MEDPRVRGLHECVTDLTPRKIDYAAANFHQHAVATTSGRKTLGDLPQQWRESVTMQVALLKGHLPARAKVLEIKSGGFCWVSCNGRGF